MRQEDILKEKYGTDTGFTVPDGYFEELNSRIMSALPPCREVRKEVAVSKWQRIKPYLYLAAMFAGIWMMMKVFHTVSTSGRLSLDNPPEAIVQLMDGDTSDLFPFVQDGSEFEVEEEVCGNYDTFDEFEDDFGYELSPEYATIDIPANTIGAISV